MLRTTRAPLAAFLLLCLLGSLGPLRSELAPRVTVSLVPLWLVPAWPYLLAALTAAALTQLRGIPWLPAHRVRAAILIGFGLFIIPAITLRAAGTQIDSFTAVILLALTPIFTAVLEPHIGCAATQPRHALVAATAAALGLILYFPFQLPRTVAEAASWLLLMITSSVVAASYCRAALLTIQSPQSFAAPAAAIACAASSAALILIASFAHAYGLSFASRPVNLLWSTFVDTPGLLLLFWLLPRLAASRLSSHFVITPLFTSVVALIVVRPAITLRDISGLILATVGSAWLLFAPSFGRDDSSSTLGLMDAPPR